MLDLATTLIVITRMYKTNLSLPIQSGDSGDSNCNNIMDFPAYKHVRGRGDFQQVRLTKKKSQLEQACQMSKHGNNPQ